VPRPPVSDEAQYPRADGLVHRYFADFSLSGALLAPKGSCYGGFFESFAGRPHRHILVDEYRHLCRIAMFFAKVSQLILGTPKLNLICILGGETA
jgi:hypothetical protein